MESFKLNRPTGAEKPSEKLENLERKEAQLKSLKRHLLATILFISSFAAPEKLQAESGKEIPSTPAVSAKAESAKEIYKKDFEEFQKLVEIEKINEKISFLEKTLDNNLLERLFVILKIKSDLAVLEKVNVEKSNRKTFVPKHHFGKNSLPTPAQTLAQAYEERWKNIKKTYKPVEFINIDSVPGLSPELLNNFLKSNYPQKYTEGSTDSIEFVEEREILGNIELRGQVKSADIDLQEPVPSSAQGETNDILIFDAGGELNKEDFFEILKHEIHHTNDWKTSRLLNSADRISMLYDITKRTQEADRYTSTYLGFISKEGMKSRLSEEILKKINLDKTFNFVLTAEYWPEIAKAYFENKEQFKKEHPKDYELVKKWIDKMTEDSSTN